MSDEVLELRATLDHQPVLRGFQEIQRESIRTQQTLTRLGPAGRSGLSALASASTQARTELQALEQSSQRTGRGLQALQAQAARSAQQTAASARALAQGAGSAGGPLENIRNKHKSIFDQLRDGLDGMQKRWLAIGAVLGVVTASVFAGVGGLIRAGAEWEQTNVAFTTFLGSARAAKDVLGDLVQYANYTPYDTKSVIDSGRALLAFGISAKDLIPTLKAVGDVAAGVNTPLTELATIVGKAKASYTVYAEDINQLTGRGIPIISEFAKILGVTESQVKKLGSEGKITYDTLMQAFTNMTAKGGRFANMMDRQSKTFGGLWSTLEGNLQTVGIAAGTALADSLKPALQLLVDVSGAMAGAVSDAGVDEATAAAEDSFKNLFETVAEGEAAFESLGAAERQIGDAFDHAAVLASARALQEAGTKSEELELQLARLAHVAAGTGLALEEVSTMFARAQDSGGLDLVDFDHLTQLGVPLSAFADEMNVPIERVRELAAAGAISGETLQRVFERITAEGGTFATSLADQNRLLAVSGELAGDILPAAEIERAAEIIRATDADSKSWAGTLQMLADVAAGAVGPSVAGLAQMLADTAENGHLSVAAFDELVASGVPVEAFATQLGVPAERLREMAEQSRITGADLRGVFQILTQEGGRFAGRAAEQERAFDSQRKAAGIMAAAFVSALAAAAAFQHFSTGSLVPSIVAGAKKMGVAMWAAVGPVGIAIGLLAAAVAGLAYVIYENWDSLSDISEPLQDAFHDLGSSLGGLKQLALDVLSTFFEFDPGQVDWIETLRTGFKILVSVAIVAIAQFAAFLGVIRLVYQGLFDLGKAMYTLFTKGPAAAWAELSKGAKNFHSNSQSLAKGAVDSASRLEATWRSERDKTAAHAAGLRAKDKQGILDLEGTQAAAHARESVRSKERMNAYAEYIRGMREETQKLREEIQVRERVLAGDGASYAAADELWETRLKKLTTDLRNPDIQRALAHDFAGKFLRIDMRAQMESLERTEDGKKVAGILLAQIQRGVEEGWIPLTKEVRELLAGDIKKIYESSAESLKDGMTVFGQFQWEVPVFVSTENVDKFIAAIDQQLEALGDDGKFKKIRAQLRELKVTLMDREEVFRFEAFLQRTQAYLEKYREPLHLRFAYSESDFAAVEARYRQLEEQGAITGLEFKRHLDESTGKVTVDVEFDVANPEAITAVEKLQKDAKNEPIEFKVKFDEEGADNWWKQLKQGARETAKSLGEAGRELSSMAQGSKDLGSGFAGAAKALGGMVQGLGRMAGALGTVMQLVQQFVSAWSMGLQAQIDMMRGQQEKANFFFDLLATLGQNQANAELAQIEAVENARIESIRRQLDEKKRAIEAERSLLDDEYRREKERIEAEYAERLLREEDDYLTRRDAYAAEETDYAARLAGQADMDQRWSGYRALIEKEKNEKLEALLAATNAKKEKEVTEHTDALAAAEEQKEARIQAAKEQHAARDKQLKKGQAIVSWLLQSGMLELQKRMQIMQARIQGAMGILDAVKAGAMVASTIPPPFGVIAGAALTAKLIAMIAQATTMSIQAISSQFVPPPMEIFQAERGLVLRGRRHAQGGIPLHVSGGGYIEAEDGEIIINRRSSRKYYDVLSEINAREGGLRFPGSRNPYADNPYLAPALQPGLYEHGGLVGDRVILRAPEMPAPILRVPAGGNLVIENIDAHLTVREAMTPQTVETVLERFSGHITGSVMRRIHEEFRAGKS